MPATGVPADTLARRVTFKLCNSSKQERVESSSLCTSDARLPANGCHCWVHHNLGSLPCMTEFHGFKSRTCGMCRNMPSAAKSHINQPDISSRGSLLSCFLALRIAEKEILCCSVPSVSFVVFVVSLFPMLCSQFKRISPQNHV